VRLTSLSTGPWIHLHYSSSTTCSAFTSTTKVVLVTLENILSGYATISVYVTVNTVKNNYNYQGFY